MNNTTVQTLTCLMAVLALVGLPSFAQAEDVTHDEMVSTFTGTSSQDVTPATTKCWKNRTTGDDATVVWKSGNDYAVFPSTISTFLIQLRSGFAAYGLKNESSKTVAFSTANTSVGAGGIQFAEAGGGFSFGYYTPMNILTLADNQTWEGKNTSGMSVVSIGYEDKYHKPYTDSRIVAKAGVTDLTITGLLAAIFYSPNNNLANVAVRVENGAELILPDVTMSGTDSGSTLHTMGKLNAKSVVFSGDGVRARFGLSAPVVEKYMNKSAPTTVATIDSNHLAPAVTLENGADFAIGNAFLGLEELTVTGGDSAIAGMSLTFKNSAVEFAIGEVATLTLDAALLSAESTEVSVTGLGTLVLTQAPNFKGSIDVAEDVTLKLQGAGPTITPIAGSGKIQVALASDAETFIADITEFSGSIEVAGGTLYLSAEPAGGVTTSGGGRVVYGASKYVGAAPVENQLIKVGAGETLFVCGDGLKETSTVWMNGGTLRVMCDSVISATVTQDVTSVYTATNGNADVEFAGPWLLHTDYAGVKSVAKVYGGGVRVTGGLRAETEKDEFYVYSGTIRFSRTDGYFDGNCGASDSITLWEIDGVTYDLCYKEGNHGGRSSPTSGLAFTFGSEKNATLSVVNGGALKITTNRSFQLSSRSRSSTMTLLIDGGNLAIQNSYGETVLGQAWPYSNVAVDFRGGAIEFKRPFVLGSDEKLDFSWRGGTIKPVFDGNRRLGSGGVMFKDGKPGSAVRICGSDCVLDLSGVTKNLAVTNWVSSNLSLSGTPGGKLTVKGLASGTNAVLLNGYDPAGSSLMLENNAQVVVPSVSGTFALGEFCVNGMGCSLAAETLAGTPTVGTMRVGAKGKWHNAVLTGIGDPVFANLVFDDGALWCPEQTDEPLVLTGTLSFGETVRYAVTRPSGTGARVFTAVTALGGIVGSPEWIRDSGSRYIPEIRGNDVFFGLNGFFLLLR